MELLHPHMLLALGVLGLGGLLLGEGLHKLRIPAISGYLVLGLLLGPTALGLLDVTQLKGLERLSELALGLIALTVGLEFEWQHVKELGVTMLVLAVVAALGALAAVLVGVGLYTGDWRLALLLAAIATATAPAATFLTIAEYKAAGPLCETTKMVVALDDALGIAIFALALSAAELLSGEATTASVGQGLGLAAWELIGSPLMGFGLGLGLSRLSRRLRRWSIPLLLSGTLLAVGVAHTLHLSALLTCMAVGAALVNTNPRATRELEGLEPAFDVIYILFFGLAGASLHLDSIISVGLLGGLYIALRAVGKYGGAVAGSLLTRRSRAVTSNLGLTLMPQAGVAVGMAMICRERLPAFADTITTVVLAGVLVFELVGPMCTRLAIVRAGEVGRAADCCSPDDAGELDEEGAA